jgi:uncharacterized protein (TIGR02444 family)
MTTVGWGRHGRRVDKCTGKDDVDSESADAGRDDLQRFALAVYTGAGVPSACLLLQNRVDLDVNLILFAAYVGAVRGMGITDARLTTARQRAQDWHLEVVRPLRSVRQRLKSGPSPAPSPATTELRRRLQEIEVESELIELAELNVVAAGLDGPPVSGTPAERAAEGIAVVVRVTAGRDLDDAELRAVGVIAAAAALVRMTEAV